MTKRRIGIIFEPKLYAEAIVRALCTSDVAGSYEFTLVDLHKLQTLEPLLEFCLIVMPVSFIEGADRKKLPPGLRKYKLLAISPDGKFAKRRLPGKRTWEEVSPYGLPNLISELSWTLSA